MPDAAGYQALIFDCDGTLADNHPAHYAALNEVLQRYGVRISWDWYTARTGLPGAETLAEAAEEHSLSFPVPVSDLAAECETAYLRHLHLVREASWVADIARGNSGRPTAVASSGRRASVEATLGAIDLESSFHAVVTREDVQEVKPAPDLFLLAARRLGAEPTQCLVFEDSDEGCLAAQRAGMTVTDVRQVASNQRPG